MSVLFLKLSHGWNIFYYLNSAYYYKGATPIALRHGCSLANLLHPWSIALVSLLLTLNRFCLFFRRFYCLVWTCKYRLGKRQYQILEAATRGGLQKRVFLETSQNSQEKTCAKVSFLITLQAWGLQIYKKETLAQVFSCEFWEILRTPF